MRRAICTLFAPHARISRERDVDEVVPVRRPEHEPGLARGIVHDLVMQTSLSHEPQQPVDLVDRQDRGRRVVDRRRQRLQRDVHQDPEREHRVLLHRALGPECDALPQGLLVDRCRAAIEPEKWFVGRNEIADLRDELDDAVHPRRFRHQCVDLYCQHDQGPALLADDERRLLGRAAPVAPAAGWVSAPSRGYTLRITSMPSSQTSETMFTGRSNRAV